MTDISRMFTLGSQLTPSAGGGTGMGTVDAEPSYKGELPSLTSSRRFGTEDNAVPAAGYHSSPTALPVTCVVVDGGVAKGL